MCYAKKEMENVLFEEKYIQRFLQDLKQNKLSHGYLIISPDRLFNEIVATQMAAILLCKNKIGCEICEACQKIEAKTHPDFLLFPENNNFLVDDAEVVVEKSTQSPMLGDVKVFLIKDIDKATIQAQNKILKTLEEPTKSTIFILTATNESKVLPTVISRMRREYLTPLDQDKVKTIIENPSKIYASLFGEKHNYIGNEFSEAIVYGEGWVGKTLQILQNTSFKDERKLAQSILENLSSSKQLSSFSAAILALKDNLGGFLLVLENEFRKMLSSLNEETKQCGIEIIEAINNCSLELERNVSPALAVDNLLMRILEIKYNYKV